MRVTLPGWTTLLACAGCATLGAPAGSTASSTGARTSSTAEARPSPAGGTAAQGLRDRSTGAAAELFAREATGLSPHRVSIPAMFDVEVPLSAPAELTRDGDVHRVSLAFGSESPATCVVRPDRVDLASSVRGMIVEAADRVELQAVRVHASEVAGATPIMGATAFYLDISGPSPAPGAIKVRAATNHSGSILCWHDEVGFEETLAGVSRALAQGLDGLAAEARRAEVESVDVAIVKLDGASIGYSEEITRRSSRGERVSQEVSSMLVAKSPTDLIARDSYEVVRADEDGRVLVHNHADADNGALSVNLTLVHKGGRTYGYSGLFRSREVAGHFDAKEELIMSAEHQRRFSAQIRGGQPAKVAFESYSPNTRLDGTTTITLEGEPGRFRMETEELQITGTLDSDGWPLGGRLEAGRLVLELERAFFWGRRP